MGQVDDHHRGSGNLTGGTVGFHPLLTCGGFSGSVKYANTDTAYHETNSNPSSDCRRYWCRAVHPGLPNIPHIQSGESFGILPWRVYLHRGLHFFIERWENERDKAKFEVTSLEAPPNPAELFFHLIDGQVKRTAYFFEVSVCNVGVRTAEKVVPIVLIPDKLASGVGLFFLSRPPQQQTTIRANWFEKDFTVDNIASAMIDIVAIKQLDLYGGGVGQQFALFFTLNDSDKIYFPCQTKMSLRLPQKFALLLSFQGKDMPIHHSKIYEVDAKAWDDVSITELSSDPLRFLKASGASVDHARNPQ